LFLFYVDLYNCNFIKTELSRFVIVKSRKLSTQYGIKLFSSVLGSLFGILNSAIVPKALGVINYGAFSFTTNFFLKFWELFEFRTSYAFFTKVAQRPKEFSLISFYLFYAALISVMMIVFTAVAAIPVIREAVFPNIPFRIVIYALFYAISTRILDLFSKILDARGDTVFLEVQRLINRAITAALIFMLYYLQKLNVDTYFLLAISLPLFLIFLLFVFLNRKGVRISLLILNNYELFKQYVKEFWGYSAPLMPYTLIAFCVPVFDMWWLQKQGGSAQMGYYAFAFMVTYYPFMFTQALQPIFTREIAKAAKPRDIEKMSSIFNAYVPAMYSVTALFSAFVFVEADSIIMLLGGKQYEPSLLAFRILAFYPLLSLYSNLNGAVVYANEFTSLFLKLSLFFFPVGILASTVLIGDDWFNLGAVGLAIKMVVLEFSSVVVVLFILTRFLKGSFWKYLLHIILAVIPFVIIAFVSDNFIESIELIKSQPMFFQFLIKGILYVIFVAGIGFIFPKIVGLHIVKSMLKF